MEHGAGAVGAAVVGVVVVVVVPIYSRIQVKTKSSNLLNNYFMIFYVLRVFAVGGQRHDRFWTQAPISLPGALLPMSRLLLGTSGLEHPTSSNVGSHCGRGNLYEFVAGSFLF